MNFTLNCNWPCPCLCFGTQKACIKPRWTFLSEELWGFFFFTVLVLSCLSASYYVAVVLMVQVKLCSTLKSAVGNLSSLAFSDIVSRPHILYLCKAIQLYFEIIWYSVAIFMTSTQVGVGLKQLAHLNQQHTCTDIHINLCPAHPWIKAVYSPFPIECNASVSLEF